MEYFEGLIYSLGINDFALPIGVFLWSLIFLVPLKNIDFSDISCALIFASYCSMYGIFIINIIPQEHHEYHDFRSITLSSIFYFLIALLWWFRKYTQQTKVIFRSQTNE